MATPVTDLPPVLLCPAEVGSLNNPANTPQQLGTNVGNPNAPYVTPSLSPYVAPIIQVGTWQITGLNPDTCAINEQLIEQQYVAESLNISGAPINVYALQGVHQQGQGSVLSQGVLFSSTPYPGYPLTGINTSNGWRSLPFVTPNSIYIGLDFGSKLLPYWGNQSEYDPPAPNFMNVGSINITQSNIPGDFASQVKVEIADGACTLSSPQYTGTGNGIISNISAGTNVSQGSFVFVAENSNTFTVSYHFNNMVTPIGILTIGIPFYSVYINATINSGNILFVNGDIFTVNSSYVWRRVALFNLVQSNTSQVLNLKTTYLCKAVMITPTIFNGSNPWVVMNLDVMDSPPTDINNIQDLFFMENRDREYNITPQMIKCQYQTADSVSDLSRFGLSILDQYSFTVSFVTMVTALGRPIVIGDIVEVIPEMQWDQNLNPVRKFIEVTETGWSAAGFGPQYNPTVYRFSGQVALPSQETRDIWGTVDTTKYLMQDSVLMNGIGKQIDTIPLTNTEEIIKMANNLLPETGSDDNRTIESVLYPAPNPARNPNGQPLSASNPALNSGPNLYVEDGLPPEGLPYTEGYVLPDTAGLPDGTYFRLNYAESTNIPARLYRYSALKNRWIAMEQDKRKLPSSYRPSMQRVLNSSTNAPLSQKGAP
jgi:hypothetical protein